MRVADPASLEVSAEARRVLETLWANGHAAYAVGGGVRDHLLGRTAHDVDIATDATPDRMLELLPDGHTLGVFGTVEVDGVQATTFRRDHRYADHRRPDEVTWTTDLTEDLRRRDFTINALAWGRGAGTSGPPALVDPTGGLDDLRTGVLRAVGDADARFDEDALRILRGARFAAALDLGIEPSTLAAMTRHGTDVAHLSGERIGQELHRMLALPQPSRAFRLLERIGSLGVTLPEVALQRGVPQAKIPGDDLFDHSMRTMDAAAAMIERSGELVMAGLLHDIGKPATAVDGHFLGHPEVGARMAVEALRRLRTPAVQVSRVERLIAGHMFQYRASWTDAAVRRFLRRTGADLVDDLLRLRLADNIGSGVAMDATGVRELWARVDAQRADNVPLSLADLAVGGRDLLRVTGRPAGPWVGVFLERLLGSVVNDPGRNRRDVLLADVRRWATDPASSIPAADPRPTTSATDTTASGRPDSLDG